MSENAVAAENAVSEDDLTKIIEELCNSKAEEFAMVGYENVTGKDVWDCVNEKYRNGLPQLHRLVNDILSLKVTQYMNWMTLNAYKGIPF